MRQEYRSPTDTSPKSSTRNSPRTIASPAGWGKVKDPGQSRTAHKNSQMLLLVEATDVSGTQGHATSSLRPAPQIHEDHRPGGGTVWSAHKAAGEPVFRKSPVASRCRLRLFTARTQRRFEHELCGPCPGEIGVTVEKNDTSFCFSNLLTRYQVVLAARDER